MFWWLGDVQKRKLMRILAFVLISISLSLSVFTQTHIPLFKSYTLFWLCVIRLNLTAGKETHHDMWVSGLFSPYHLNIFQHMISLMPIIWVSREGKWQTFICYIDNWNSPVTMRTDCLRNFSVWLRVIMFAYLVRIL